MGNNGNHDNGEPRSVGKLQRASELDAAKLLHLADLSRLDSKPAELVPSAEGIALFDPAARSNGNGNGRSVLMEVAEIVSGLTSGNAAAEERSNANGAPPPDPPKPA